MARAGLLVAVLSIGVFAALALALGQLLLAALLSALLLVPIGFALFVMVLGPRHDLMFWVLVLTLFGSSLVSSVLRINLSSVSTALLLLCVPLVMLSVLPAARTSRPIALILALTASFYVIGLLSSVLGRSQTVPAIYSMLMSVKPFVLLGLGAALTWSSTSDNAFQRLLRWTWLPLVVLVALQWFAPAAYAAVLSDRESLPGDNPFLPGVPRALGLFTHPAVMAAIVGCFALFCFVNALMDKRQRFWMLMLSAVYLALVVAAGQRQELAACLLALVLAFAVSKWRPTFSALLLIAVAAAIPVALVLYQVMPATINNELANFGIGPGYGRLAARAVLYGDSFDIANRYWPLGSGFGTFASVGSVRFDQSQFIDLGYNAFWWFRTSQSYLQDAFWSRYIAETGWLGLIAHLVVYLIVLRQVVSWLRLPVTSSNAKLHRRVVYAIVGLVFLLLVSPSGNVLSEPHGGLMALVFVGVAWQELRAARGRQEERDQVSITRHGRFRQSSSLSSFGLRGPAAGHLPTP